MNKNSGTEYVITLVAGVSTTLSNDFLHKVVSHIEKSGALVVRSAWLEEAKAADIFCKDIAFEALHPTLTNHIKDQPVDFIAQPASNRRKKLFLADMESTIIEQEMLDELADVIGCRDEVAGITRRAMNGEMGFDEALRERVALFKDQPVAILDRVVARITDMPGAKKLLMRMKKEGATCWLVSGGFTYFAEPVATRLGFDRVCANKLIVRDGRMSGEVAEPILDKNTKKSLLEQACGELNLSLNATLTVGDGANDIPLLAACHAGGGLAIAYHAKPRVRQTIPNQVNYADLTALLYAQGYGSNHGS